MSIKKRNSIGLICGVISLAGVCVGIFRLRKKSIPVARRVSQTVQFGEPIELSYSVHEQREWNTPSENSEVFEVEPVEVHVESEVDGVSLPEVSGPGEQVVESAPELRTSSDEISELYKMGKSNLEIARALRISLGEVQLTIKLRGLRAFGAAAAGTKNF